MRIGMQPSNGDQACNKACNQSDLSLLGGGGGKARVSYRATATWEALDRLMLLPTRCAALCSMAAILVRRQRS